VAAFTLIISFVKILTFSTPLKKIKIQKNKNFGEENEDCFRIFWNVLFPPWMESSKIN
jgi:hypothetical protein